MIPATQEQQDHWVIVVHKEYAETPRTREQLVKPDAPVKLAKQALLATQVTLVLWAPPAEQAPQEPEVPQATPEIRETPVQLELVKQVKPAPQETRETLEPPAEQVEQDPKAHKDQEVFQV